MAAARRDRQGVSRGAPTISETTAAFGTSRQNVKQVAQQLERRGWLHLEPDPADARVVRLVLTGRLAAFDDPAVQADQSAFIDDLFGGLTRQDRRTFLDLVTRCIANPSSPAGQAPPCRRDTS